MVPVVLDGFCFHLLERFFFASLQNLVSSKAYRRKKLFIPMKFIPVPVFETINSIIQGVEAQGCLLTLRLEAFTCRHTKEEKQLIAAMTERRSQLQCSSSPASGMETSPILQPSSGGYQHGGMFPPIEVLPPAIDGPGDASGFIVAAQGSSGHIGQIDSNSDSVPDDRLVYLVAALNAIHGDGYDFSVLSESDFDLMDPQTLRNEVDQMLSSLPPPCCSVTGVSSGHETFWQSIADVIWGSASVTVEQLFSQCDFFLFRCPTCDPIAQRTIWSSHVFAYCKKQRMMISLLCYGEGNLYRGDDGLLFAGAAGTVDEVGGGEFYFDGETTHYLSGGVEMDENSQSQTQQTADMEQQEEYEVDRRSEMKNRDFYGY
jgi:hypothetical protein